MKIPLKILKSTWRDLKYSFDKNKTKFLEPESFFIYQSLELECRSPSYFFYTWPEKKLIYIEVPKCASSYILRLLSKARHGLEFEARNPHNQYDVKLPGPIQLGVSQFIDLLTDPESFIFSIVRNPYDRAVSCYLDKFADVKIGDGSHYSKFVTHWWRFMDRPPPVDRSITFDEFCTLAHETALIGIDGHWALQSKIIPSRMFPPQFVGKFENLQEDLLGTLKKIGVGGEVIEFAIASFKAPRVAESQTFFTPELRRKISETYMDDFVRFGYQP